MSGNDCDFRKRSTQRNYSVHDVSCQQGYTTRNSQRLLSLRHPKMTEQRRLLADNCHILRDNALSRIWTATANGEVKGHHSC